MYLALAVLVSSMALFEPYNTEKPYSHEVPGQVTRDHLNLRERLGYAILLRAGYLRVTLKSSEEEDSEKDKPVTGDAYLDSVFKEDQPDLVCLAETLAVRLPDGDRLNIHNLSVAILAAEKYNRSSFQRKMEDWLASLSLQFRGKLPDYSLGIGQVRPSTARRILQKESGEFSLSDQDLKDLLVNECTNIRLAGRYIKELSHELAPKSVNVDDLVAKVAQAYSGSVTPTINGLTYVDAVLGAYLLLSNMSYLNTSEEQDEQDEEVEESTGAVLTCVYFGAGEVTVSDLKEDVQNAIPEGKELQVQDSQVSIFLRQAEPGPQAYLEHLASRRRGGLIDGFVKLGFSEDQIHFTDPSSFSFRRDSCPDEPGPLLSWASIKLEQAIGAGGGEQPKKPPSEEVRRFGGSSPAREP